MKPIISVIVPIYNVERYLRECLDSIVNQTFKDVEIILIDDGSTDGSPAIVDEYAGKDYRIVAIHKENGGYASGINYGLGIANGEYISIIESDDYAALDMLESLYDAAIKSDAEVVISDYTFIDDSINKKYRNFNYGVNVKKDKDGYFNLQTSPSIIHKPAYPWHKLYKFSFLKENNIKMREDGLGAYQDQAWNAEILSKSKKLFHIPKKLYFYRLDAAGSSTNTGKRSMINYLARRRQARGILLENGAFTENVKEFFYLSSLYGCDFFFQRIHPNFKKEYYSDMQNLMQTALSDGITFKFFNPKEKREYNKRITKSYFSYKASIAFRKIKDTKLFTSEKTPDGRHKYIRFMGHKLLRYNRTPLKYLSLVRLLDKFIKKDPKKIIFFSFPDYSDNSRCFFEYLQENHPNEWDVTWVRLNQRNFPAPIPSKWVLSWSALWKILKAKYIVMNTFNDFQRYISSDKHVMLQLWHGMPIKTIGYLEKGVPSNILELYKRNENAYFFITSDVFKKPMLSCFRMNPHKIFVTGQPRTDRAFIPHDSEKIKEFLKINDYKYIIVYSTTYKELLRNGAKDVDKEFNNIFYMDDYSEDDFLNKLSDKNILLLIKPHPIEESAFRKYKKLEQKSKNIKIIFNSDLEKNGFYFYDFFPFIDAMISDFSSIAIDYMIKNKPIIYLTNLSDEYEKNRGFIQPEMLDAFMPGAHVKTFPQLLEAIDDALENDSFKEKRTESLKQLHKYIDANASERIYNIMKGL